MNGRVASIFFIACGVPAALVAQQPEQPPEVYRFDFTLVRSEGEDRAERTYSMLVSNGRGASVRESAAKMTPGNQSISVGVSFRVQVREPVGSRLSVELGMDITEIVGEAAARVDVSGSTTMLAPLGERVSLLSVQSQDGRRQYELRATVQRIDD